MSCPTIGGNNRLRISKKGSDPAQPMQITIVDDLSSSLALQLTAHARRPSWPNLAKIKVR
jgi:hypothetical protein